MSLMQGLHPLPDKVQAVQQAPTPRSVTELKSYLGLLTYYGKFLPNLATHLAPLYKLLGTKVKWKWTSKQDKAFRKSKELLTSSQLLVHFDPKLPLLLACDASAYGIGAVLAHKMPDGSEKPIGYASRTLNSAERNYSQLEKEGLSCVFGVKCFYSYLFGHPFLLITDHKPLLGLLSEQKPQPHHKRRLGSVVGPCICPCLSTPCNSGIPLLTQMQMRLVAFPYLKYPLSTEHHQS